MNTLLDALVLFLPAGIANMAPPIANKVPGLNRWRTPMDFGKSYRGIRIFGDHKTWRGFVSGTICGTVYGIFLHAVHYHTTYSLWWFLLFCAVLSAGALLGDAIKSFFKRRSRVKPGASWFPFDQLDYIIGALVLTVPFHTFSLPMMGVIAITYFVGHLAASYIGYKIGTKDTPI